jgi:23S rRNA (pseudouridine1915-N3)-methyltransferase
MKLLLLAIGKTESGALAELTADFTNRLNRYIPFEMEIVPEVRTKGRVVPQRQKQEEAEALLSRVQPTDTVWLLDENGREFTSRGFAHHLQKAMNSGPKRLVLVIGGAYGHGEAMQARAVGRVSLSKMTFNHQVVRLLALEQLYRAYTILKGDPYHND